MGRVYQARHQRVSRRFAIKVLFGDHATDEKMRERFAREAEAASRLEHANVISVVNFGETGQGLLYLVMDFVEGRELYDVIDDEAPMPRERVIDLVMQLCRGLAYAHGQGLVHRDFKSENVIVTERDGREVPRIVNFGIAILTEADDERLTTEGLVLGTPAYMAPEQATGGAIDHRTDLFSLGVLMYELLAGVMPFEGSPLQVARANMTLDPPPIADRVPGLAVAPELEAICRKLMAKRPDDRYQSATEVLDALAALDEAAPEVSPLGQTAREAPAASPPAAQAPATTGEAVAASRPSRRWLWLAALALLGAAVAVVLLTRGGSGRSSTAATVSDAGAPALPPVVAQPVERPARTCRRRAGRGRPARRRRAAGEHDSAAPAGRRAAQSAAGHPPRRGGAQTTGADQHAIAHRAVRPRRRADRGAGRAPWRSRGVGAARGLQADPVPGRPPHCVAAHRRPGQPAAAGAPRPLSEVTASAAGAREGSPAPAGYRPS